MGLDMVVAAVAALLVAAGVAAAPVWSLGDMAWTRARLGPAARAVRSTLAGVTLIFRRRGKGGAEETRTSLREVSEMIDVVRLGLSAGLSFDAALELFCTERTGALARALAQALFSWRVGLVTREEGLADVARTLDVRALETFANASSQAIELGAPLAETLHEQGREIKAAHRAAVEREIEKVPVKLLIPTGALILPALLLSIIGPLVAASGMM